MLKRSRGKVNLESEMEKRTNNAKSEYGVHLQTKFAQQSNLHHLHIILAIRKYPKVQKLKQLWKLVLSILYLCIVCIFCIFTQYHHSHSETSVPGRLYPPLQLISDHFEPSKMTAGYLAGHPENRTKVRLRIHRSAVLTQISESFQSCLSFLAEFRNHTRMSRIVG